jgi:DsbC/DsbD-like thiol-disulfide interchange protein
LIIRSLACSIALLVAASGVWPGAAAGRVLSKATRHLAVTATLTPDIVTAGTRMSLVFDVTPKTGMHVYAPGTKYRAVAIALESNPALHVHETIYPPPTPYLFKPLNENVLVYERPFRLMLDVTAGGTTAQQAALGTRSRLTIKGQLTYQACDERVCYLPAAVPFDWNIKIAR